MKPVSLKMLSQITKRTSAGFLKRNPGFQVATVRYQSNKTASSDEKTKAELAAKVAKQKQKHSEKYNALSNQNLLSQQSKTPSPKPKSATPKKIKVDYSAIPRVPGTQYYTYKEIAYESLMDGHRPLLMFHRKEEPNLLLETISKTPTFWSQSVTGQQKFKEWDSIPFHEAVKLKPFQPPLSPKEKEQKKIKETEQKLAGYIDSLQYMTKTKGKSKTSRVRSKKSKTSGRYRPSYDLDYDNGDDY